MDLARRPGLLKVDGTGGHCLGFLCVPGDAERLSPRPDVGLSIAGIDPTRIRQDGVFAAPFGLPGRFVIGRGPLQWESMKDQVVSTRLDRMEVAALVRDPVEMMLQRARKP